MLFNYDIEFQKGTILTSEMLTMMHKVPNAIINNLFVNQSDGIINGLNLQVEDNTLIVTSGIYKVGNRLYISPKDRKFNSYMNKSFSPDKVYCLGFKGDKTICDLKNPNITTHRIDLEIYPPSMESEYPNNICQFYGKSGLRLPKDTTDLFKTRSAMDILNCKYSSLGEYTYHPYVFKLIYDKLKIKPNKHPLDYSFMMEISHSGVIPKPMIREYIHATGKDIPQNDKDLLKVLIQSIDDLEFKVIASTPQKNDTNTIDNPKATIGSGFLL